MEGKGREGEVGRRRRKGEEKKEREWAKEGERRLG